VDLFLNFGMTGNQLLNRFVQDGPEFDLGGGKRVSRHKDEFVFLGQGGQALLLAGGAPFSDRCGPCEKRGERSSAGRRLE